MKKRQIHSILKVTTVISLLAFVGHLNNPTGDFDYDLMILIYVMAPLVIVTTISIFYLKRLRKNPDIKQHKSTVIISIALCVLMVVLSLLITLLPRIQRPRLSYADRGTVHLSGAFSITESHSKT